MAQKKLLLIRLSLFAICLFTIAENSLAAITITRGQSSTINWSVSNVVNCQGSTNYPNNADGVQSAWQGSTRNATGNATFTFTSPGTYTFMCTNAGAGASGVDTITINNCSGGTPYWNGSSCIPTPSPCSAQSLSWSGGNCSGNITSTPSGTSNSVTNNAAGYAGSADYSCSNGTYTFTSGTCNVSSMSGTLTSTFSTCTIGNGSATCNRTFTWTTTNPVGVSQVVGDLGGPSSISSNNNSQSLAVKYNTGLPHIFRLYNNAQTLAQRGVTADCQSSSAWNGASCQACANGGCTNHVCNNGATNAPTCSPAPTITSFTASPSNITIGDSSNLAWTTSGATSCNIDQNIGIVSVNSNISTGALGSTKTYTLSCTNAGGLISTDTVTVTVSVGTTCGVQAMSWSGGNCSGPTASTLSGSSYIVTNNNSGYTGSATYSCLNGTYTYSSGSCGATTMAGSLTTSPASCLVPNGGTTCNSTFTWATVNPVGTSQVVGDGGGPFSTAVNSGSQALPVNYINGVTAHIFRLYNSATALVSRGVTADCQSSSAWNGTSCQACANGGCTNHVCNNGATDAPTCSPAPTITSLIGTPSIIAANDNSTLSWSGVSGATSCNLNGGEFSSIPVGQAASGNQLTSPIVSTTLYSLSCTNNGGLTSQRTTTVSVVDPQVAAFTLSGNNTPAGIFSLTCTGSTRYNILKEGVSVYGGSQVYPGFTVTRNVATGDGGNYVGVCINGPIERYSAGILYDSDPVRPIISLTASPRTLSKNTKTLLSWNIQNPVAPGVNCTINSKAVCTAGGCSAEQTSTQTSISSTLSSGLIDAGGVTITNSVRGAPLVSGRAIGSKTLQLANSMDFTITCTHPKGPVISSVRTMVTETNEQ